MSYYERCETLFRDYPLAIEPTGPGAITLTLPSEDPVFYVLGRCAGGAYEIWPYDGGNAERIEPGTTEIARQCGEALMRGVPLPRHGSMFGWVWRHPGEVDALLTIDSDGPVPAYGVMIRTDGTSSQPPYSGQPFGEWFWLDKELGYLPDLADTVSQTRGTVFWVPQVMPDDSGVIVVREPVRLGRGHGDLAIPAGVYAYWKYALGEGSPRDVAEPLSRTGTQDLGPAFARRNAA